LKKFAIGCGALVVLGLIVLVIIVIAGGSYNRLVRLSQAVDSSWAQCKPIISAARPHSEPGGHRIRGGQF